MSDQKWFETEPVQTGSVQSIYTMQCAHEQCEPLSFVQCGQALRSLSESASDNMKYVHI